MAGPFAWVADAGSGVATGEAGSTVFTGHASIEVEALDSECSQGRNPVLCPLFF
ncbi:MAG: hypothetical protein WBN95_03915 [Gammaproteobacteria bacterium]